MAASAQVVQGLIEALACYALHLHARPSMSANSANSQETPDSNPPPKLLSQQAVLARHPHQAISLALLLACLPGSISPSLSLSSLSSLSDLIQMSIYHVLLDIYICVHMYIYIYIYTHIRCMYVCMYVCMYIYIYTHARMHAYTTSETIRTHSRHRPPPSGWLPQKTSPSAHGVLAEGTQGPTQGKRHSLLGFFASCHGGVGFWYRPLLDPLPTIWVSGAPHGFSEPFGVGLDGPRG